MDAIERSLIRELLNAAFASRTGVNAVGFRAKHEDFLDTLDRLEQGPYIERRDNSYRVKLLALVELKGEDARIDTLLCQCDQVFCFLRPAYKDRTNAPISLAEISQETNIPESQLRLVLTYMIDTPIWGGYTSDLLNSQDVKVWPGEGILRYKTFNDIIRQLRSWADRSSNERSPATTSQTPKALFMSEMEAAHLPAPGDLPQWYPSLPNDIQEMLKEVRYALRKELRALPAMGLRSVIDMICNDQVGDIGGFSEKLDKLEEGRLITPKKRMIIETILEVGHASIHRGHFPTTEALQTVLDTVDHLLEELYVLDKTSDSLKASVPKRKRHKKDE